MDDAESSSIFSSSIGVTEHVEEHSEPDDMFLGDDQDTSPNPAFQSNISATDTSPNEG